MARWIYILVLVIGLGSSHPATKLEPVSQSNAPKVQIGASRTGQVELTLPLKITSKEELVTWATYAMRLMASKINITLADSEDKMAPEKLQKLKNSTGIITKIIDKISDDMKKKTNGTKSKSMMMAFKDDGNKKLSSKSGKDKAKLKSPEIFSSGDTENGFGVLPMMQNQFTNTNLMPTSFNAFGKFVNELAIGNPFDHPDNEIFRDPNIFQPFDIKQHLQKTFMPSPISPNFVAENTKNFYSMIGEQSASGAMQHSMNGRPDSMVHMVPLQGSSSDVNKPSVMGAPPPNQLFLSQTLNLQPTTPRSVIAVPFEAYITITREKKNEETTSKDMLDQREASTSNLPEMTEPPKNGMDSRKTTVVFDDKQSTTAKPMDKKKKKKTSSDGKKRPPNLLQSIVRSLIANRTSYAPAPFDIGEVLTRLAKKKMPNFKRLPNRGKRNETSQKQIDDDDDGFFGNDANVGNDDGNADEPNNTDDNGGNTNTNNNANDVFDDFDDDFDNNNNNDYDDYGGGGGSLGSLEDLLPLIIPILEDISDPESDTDLGEFLQAAIPLLQGLSEPDPETGEGPDIIGLIGPILQNLLLGRDGMGSDAGAILGPLVQLIGPFIGPLSGPLVGPLSSSLSGGGDSSLGALLSAVLTPLLQPTEYGGKSPLASLLANIISVILKEVSKPDSGIDFGQLSSQLVTGVLSGASAGLSGHKGQPAPYGPAYGNKVVQALRKPQKVMGLTPPQRQQQRPVTFKPARLQQQFQQQQQQQPQQRPATQKKRKKSPTKLTPQATKYRPQATHQDAQPQVPVYNFEQLAAPAMYGAYGVPANEPNPLDLLFGASKDILGSGVSLFTSVLSASGASSGASSGGSSDSNGGDNGGAYGPPPPQYGAPPAGPYPNPTYHDSYQNTH